MTAPAATTEAPRFPAASLDRRFHAFLVDRALAWSVDGLAAYLLYRSLIADGSVALGLVLVLLTVVLVGLGLAVLQGVQGLTPGKAAMGLRVVHLGSGTPLGVGPSILRSAVLGVSALPTFGLGLATLAWTALTDTEGRRRGWHDHLAESIVVDVRPVTVPEAVVDPGPRHVVNLTAMRLVPAARPAPVPAPARRTPPPSAPAPSTPSFPSGPLTPTSAPGPALAEGTLVRGGTTGEPARWRVSVDTGESFLVEGLALVGRRPEPREGEPVRHLVPLRSEDMSVSKTHAQLQVAPDGVLVVTDRGSTNGTVLVRRGVARELAAGQPTTLLGDDVVHLGDRRLTLEREA